MKREPKGLVPHPWDLYGKPTPRDVELEGLEEDFTCEHWGDHTTKYDERGALEADLKEAEEEMNKRQNAFYEAEADYDEIRAAIVRLEK